ncbi:MAG: integrase [Ignavibacteria bacterium]
MTAAEHGVEMIGTVVHTWIARFLSTLSNANTRGTYERSLREFLRWERNDGGFRFRREDVERYKHHLVAAKRLSPVSISTYLTALRCFCRFLVAHDALPYNPAAEVEGVASPRQHRRASLSPDELTRLLDTLSVENELASRNSAIIMLMVECGLSEVEIVRLNIGDYIKDGARRILAVQGKGKTSKDDRIVVTGAAAHAMDRYIAWRRKNAGDELDTALALFVSVGPRSPGARLTTRTICAMVNRHLRKAGIKRHNVTPISLRHTAARRMADAGASPDEIRTRMRLGTVQTALLYLR